MDKSLPETAVVGVSSDPEAADEPSRGGRSKYLLTKRDVLKLFGAGTGSAIVAGGAGLEGDDSGDRLRMGAANMAELYKVGPGTWKGPLSVRADVPQQDGNDFIQTDAGPNNDQYAFHHYDGGWSKQGWDLGPTSIDGLDFGGDGADQDTYNVFQNNIITSEGEYYPVAGETDAEKSATLQSALDNHAKRGWVFAPAGTYEDPITLQTKELALFGYGRQATRIAGGVDGTGLTLDTKSGGDSSAHGVSVRDVAVSSGSGSGNANDALGVVGSDVNVFLQNVHVHESDRHAYFFEDGVSEVRGHNLSMSNVAGDIDDDGMRIAANNCIFTGVEATSHSLHFTTDAVESHVWGTFNSVTNNGSRCTVNGLGVNNGNPNDPSQWNGNSGYAWNHGITVYDTNNNRYWRPRNPGFGTGWKPLQPINDTYTGNGNSEQTVSLRFKPMAVVIEESSGDMEIRRRGLSRAVLAGSSMAGKFDLGTNGFTVGDDGSDADPNTDGETYNYWAF